MANQNIHMVRGDTLAFGVEFQGLDQDLDTAFFTCKANDTLTEYVFQKSLGDGIEKVETNKYRVRVAPEDTAEIEAGNYYYDFQIGVNDDVFTLLIGILEIQQDVTFDSEGA